MLAAFPLSPLLRYANSSSLYVLVPVKQVTGSSLLTTPPDAGEVTGAG